MYWLKPSLLPRRIAAGLLVIAALVWDARGSATVPYPFTAAPVTRGNPVEIEYRQVPAGLLPPGADAGPMGRDDGGCSQTSHVRRSG